MRIVLRVESDMNACEEAGVLTTIGLWKWMNTVELL